MPPSAFLLFLDTSLSHLNLPLITSPRNHWNYCKQLIFLHSLFLRTQHKATSHLRRKKAKETSSFPTNPWSIWECFGKQKVHVYTQKQMTTSPWIVNFSCGHKPCLLGWQRVTLSLRKWAHPKPSVLRSTVQMILFLLHAVTELHVIQILFTISDFELAHMIEKYSKSPRSNTAAFQILHTDWKRERRTSNRAQNEAVL